MNAAIAARDLGTLNAETIADNKAARIDAAARAAAILNALGAQ